MSLGASGKSSDLAAMRALAHPLRLRMLSLLTATAMSAAEIARELGITHANASYHLRQLLAAGQIEVAEEIEIRGGRARRYRYDVGRGAARLEDVPWDRDTRRTAYAALAEELRRRGALAAGPPTRQSLTDAELWVDAETWVKLCDRMTDLMAELHRVAAPPETAGAIRTSTTAAMFVMAER
jgi:DNA-binding transcriptional ArsR family regulator